MEGRRGERDFLHLISRFLSHELWVSWVKNDKGRGEREEMDGRVYIGVRGGV